MLGRSSEAEAILSGSVVLADRLGEPQAMLRARNNATQLLDEQKTASVLETASQVYEIAQRFGERTWIQQSIGTGLTAALEAGRWEDWQAQAEAELADAAGFYRYWFETERARRLAYRGHTAEADAILRQALADQSVQNSAQALAFLVMIETEIRMAEGRWIDAFDASHRALDHSDSARPIAQLAVIAAAAAGDSTRLAEAVQAQAALLTEDLPLAQAARQIAAALTALLAGRWDEARTAYLNARRLLEQIGALTLLAKVQLQVGLVAADRFPEAAEASRAAEEYFHDRGADAYVATFRVKAAKPIPDGREPAKRTSGSEVAEAERSAR
jgi:hypothetical protein